MSLKNAWPHNYLFYILLLGTILRVLIIQTPFLGEWDERFNGLISKNLIEHPLKPTLYDDPVLDNDYREWSMTHVFLEKPPLPFWFIASSIHFFGNNEIAVRIPSVIFSLFSIWFVFMLGKSLFNHKIGIYASFFYSIHGLILELVGGRQSNDHGDVAFHFFLTLSLLLVVRYFQGKDSKSKALLIGVLTGFAFMCKWIMAFFIPILWFVIAVVSIERNTFKRFFRDGALIALGWLMIALPWLIYIWNTFPLESEHTFFRIFSFINVTIEDHSHPWWYYLDRSRIIFGELIYLPMLWLLYKIYKKPSRKSRIILVVLIFMPILLLSMMHTKRVTYLLISGPGFFILSALFFHYLMKIRKQLAIPKGLSSLVLVLLIALPIRYSIERLKPFKTYPVEKKWTQELKALNTIIKDKNKVVLLNEPYPIRAMFYSGFTAYSWIPKQTAIDQIIDEGYSVYIKKENTYVKTRK